MLLEIKNREIPSRKKAGYYNVPLQETAHGHYQPHGNIVRRKVNAFGSEKENRDEDKENTGGKRKYEHEQEHRFTGIKTGCISQFTQACPHQKKCDNGC